MATSCRAVQTPRGQAQRKSSPAEPPAHRGPTQTLGQGCLLLLLAGALTGLPGCRPDTAGQREATLTGPSRQVWSCSVRGGGSLGAAGGEQDSEWGEQLTTQLTPGSSDAPRPPGMEGGRGRLRGTWQGLQAWGNTAHSWGGGRGRATAPPRHTSARPRGGCSCRPGSRGGCREQGPTVGPTQEGSRAGGSAGGARAPSPFDRRAARAEGFRASQPAPYLQAGDGKCQGFSKY